MSFGNYAVDYEQRAYNPERMRKERLARAHAMMNKYGFGALIIYNYDTWRYLGYYTLHNYSRRRPGNYVLLIKDAGFPYVAEDPHPPTWEEQLMPWLKGRMKLKTSRAFMLVQGYPDHPDYMKSEWDEMAKEVKGLLEEHGVANLPCGVDLGNANMVDACRKAGIKLVDGNLPIAEARMVKTDDEVECLRMAGVITESAHWEVCKALRPGVTEWQMAGVAANALFKLGAEELEGPSFVICSGERSGHSVPAMPTDRIIRPGDMFVIDINGVSFQGYRTCFYRTFVVGDKPTEFQKEIYDHAMRGLVEMSAAIKAGITSVEAQETWMKKGNFPGGWGAQPKWPAPGKYYFGSAGHQIGLSSGDPGPIIPGTVAHLLSGRNPPPLKLLKNMCFAQEVGCFQWDGNKWARDGVKIEYCGRVTDTGFENFYRFPFKELITVGLPGDY